MSFPPKEKLFVKMTALAASIDWPQIISRIPNAVKEIPARLPVTDRCAENWLAGRSKPNADNVVMLIAAFAVVADDIIARAGRRSGLTEVQKQKLLEVLGEK